MPFIDIPNPVIAIVGPTGSGKSQFGIQLAQKIHGEIVSVDSRLVYQGMDIGTAKPSRDEMQNVPHHMIDLITPAQSFSLAQFCEEAKKVIRQIQERNSIPILVGGTGQYVHALLENWQAPSQRPNYDLREVLMQSVAEIGPEGLHRRLSILDERAAAKIDPSNVRRTVRALEVILLTGDLFSTQRTRKAPDYSTIKLGILIERKRLYQQLDQRLEMMLQHGLVDEVRYLIQKYDPGLPAFDAIGYRQVIQALHGECSLSEAVAKIKQLTHQFVRKQANWFRSSDPTLHWIDFSIQSVDTVIEQIRDKANWQILEEVGK